MRKFGRVLCCLLVLALMLYSLTGCNTWAGMGKDIQRSGEAIEDSAD